jgi:hypothetical protein
VQAKGAPDAALLAWMEHEEFAFRVFERHIVEQRLRSGFRSVDEFVACSLSVHNRRKARAGQAFENHLAEVFRQHGLKFERAVTVEDNAKPDFVFPDAKHYFDQTFSVSLLTLLGAKTSCKDRWRQVLAESARVKDKHLVTLEPAISANQLAQMITNRLQLVVPTPLHVTYGVSERKSLWDVQTFVHFVSEKQKRAGIPLNDSQDARARSGNCSPRNG